MSQYAKETVVPVEKSRAEIEAVLRKYGAVEFHSGWREGSALVAFRIRQLFVRFVLPIPSRDDETFVYKKDRYGFPVKRSELQAEKAWEQAVRQRWRALLLTVKAKLEAVECGISTLEQEFLAFIVMPNQLTIGEWMVTHALPAIRDGQMPRLLTGPTADTGQVVDAEIVNQ